MLGQKAPSAKSKAIGIMVRIIVARSKIHGAMPVQVLHFEMVDYFLLYTTNQMFPRTVKKRRAKNMFTWLLVE